MKLSDIKRAYPPVPEHMLEGLVQTARTLQEDAPVKKKHSLALVAAIALVLLAATAVALTLQYSVEKAIPPKFADKIVPIGEHYENKWFTLDINDAFSDGTRMSLAMTFTPKEGADSVYVFPRVTAQSKGEELMPDVESGFEAFDGIWLPEKVENPAGPGNIMLEMALLTEDEEGARPSAVADDVEWDITFHVLKPNWPLETDKYTQQGYFDRDDISHEAHEQLFRDAYKNKKILLTYTDTTVEYSAYLPPPKGMSQEEFMLKRDWERLVLSGAFDEVDSFGRRFTTPGNRVVKMEAPLTMHLTGVDIEITYAELTNASGRLAYDIVYLDGSTNKDHPGHPVYQELRAGDTKLNERSLSLDTGEDSDKRQKVGLFFVTDNLDALPDKLKLVPYTLPEGAFFTSLDTKLDVLMPRQYDEARAVEIVLK